MPIIDNNVGWMIYNSFLAFIAVGLGYLTLNVTNKFLKALLGFLWFIFLPNTIYIFTDLEHFVHQWRIIHPSLWPLLTLQYTIFEVVGILTFLWAFFPFEKIIKATNLKKNKVKAIIVFNFIIAFGMVLGRVERINSWEIFTNLPSVVTSATHVLFSVNLVVLTILFGLLCNFIYFLFYDRTRVYLKKFLH